MTAEVMMKEYKNMKKELTVTEFQLRQFQGVSEQDMIDSMLYSHQEGERAQTSTLSDKTAKTALDQLGKLKGSELHSTVILSHVDEKMFKKLGVNVTYEPKRTQKALFQVN